MKDTKIKACECGHCKTIHHHPQDNFSPTRINPRNFPLCRCSCYTPARTTNKDTELGDEERTP